VFEGLVKCHFKRKRSKNKIRRRRVEGENEARIHVVLMLHCYGGGFGILEEEYKERKG
jgi:hypothetical protein